MAGPRCCKVYSCTERLARSASHKVLFNEMPARRQILKYGSLSKHCRTPAMLYQRELVAQAQEQLQAGGSGEFQPQAHLFQAQSLGLKKGSNPASHTCAPMRRKRLHPGNAFIHAARCLILGSVMVKHVQREPHTLAHLPRFSSLVLRAACRCKPPTAVDLMLETASSVQHPLRKC